MTVFRRPSLRICGLSAWIWIPPVLAVFGWMLAFPPASEPPSARASNPPAPTTAFGLEGLAEEKWLTAEEILAPFQAGSSHTRVIVNLVPSVDVARFSAWDDVAAMSDYRAEVARVVDGVLASVPSSSIDVLERYDNQASFAAYVTEGALGLLTDDERVLTVEPDRLIEAQTRQGVALIAADVVNDTYDGSGIAIAIADTGIDYGHEALGGGGFPNDKVIGGRDTGDDDDDPFDVQGHGTSCAGIAAGVDTSVGDWAGGVAPAAKLYALKISHGSGGSAYVSNMIEAWDWCITHKNDDPTHPLLVINCSFGGGQYFSECNGTSSATAIDNVAAAGITFVASSGNDGWCDALSSPACAPNAISVGVSWSAKNSNTM